MAFYTIHIPSDLPPALYRRAVRVRSPGAASWRREQEELLRSAGFGAIEALDVTDQFLETTRAWLEARLRHAHELRQTEGAETVARRIREGRATIRAIEAGLVRRSLFVARRP